MKNIFPIALIAFASLFAGCASTHMLKSERASYTPTDNKALIIFMRPSSFGGAIQSSVFDLLPGDDKLIGIVSTKTKVAYDAEPGEHLFMVIAENADFMRAYLEPGKTYYALVSPRIGVWKARFSLLPIHNDSKAKYSLLSADFTDWDTSTQFVELTPSAQQWANENRANIQEKKTDYLQKWDTKPEPKKEELTLRAQDGR